MDRRRFVRTVGMVAGSALSCAVGCGQNEFYPVLPCLDEAVLPPPVGPMTYIKASEIGCALDCDLTTGRNKLKGGPATDDAPVINAAMAGASASNPITLIIDGGALISGLFLPAGGYWSITGQGCATGFFIKSGANNDGIHNGGPTANLPSDPGVVTPGIPIPARGSDVSLSNFVLNGNRGNGHNGNSTTGLVQGAAAWYFGINLMNLNNITLENLGIVNTSAYHIRLSNVGNVTVSGCTLNTHGPSTDGVHFDGPANDITISNCSITCDDDAIALNCPEGYTGNISRVTVTGCTFNSVTMLRLYTIGGTKFNIDSVTVSDCNGTLTRAAFTIGEGTGSNPSSVDGLSVSNCKIVAPAVLELAASFGVATFSNVTLTPLDSNQDVGYAFARTASRYFPIVYAGASLVLENCVIQRNKNHAVAALILEDNSTIDTIEFNGFSVQDAAGSSYAAAPELLNIASGTIGQLVIDALDSHHITAPVNAGRFSSIGRVRGAGVLATGWQFPDNLMANETPYISANTHQASIKVGGVVHPYP